jgi:hypothetical protein
MSIGSPSMGYTLAVNSPSWANPRLEKKRHIKMVKIARTFISILPYILTSCVKYYGL